MKLYHCSVRSDLTVLEPHKARFSPFFGLFLATFSDIPEWQRRIAEDGPFPAHIYEVDVPEDVTIYVDCPNDRQDEWTLAEYKWDRVSGPHKQMWVKIPLKGKLMSMCVYCGQRSQGRQDAYGQDICDYCDDFYSANPEPPISPPVPTLVNLATGEIVVKSVKKERQ
jgi:hypothetical protein